MAAKSRISVSLETLFERALDGIFVLDRERRVVLFNAAAERMTGYSRHELLGHSCQCHEVLRCADAQDRSLAGALCPQKQLLRDPTHVGLRQTMRLRRKDGSHVWVETAYTVIRDVDDNGALTLGVMRDISEAREQAREVLATLEDHRREAERLRGELAGRYGFGSLISRADAMRPVLERIAAAAQSDLPVLIRGEPGTGHDVVARIIHDHGARRGAVFVTLPASEPARSAEATLFGSEQSRESCLWHAAADGTLHIEELARLPEAVQARLVRETLRQSPAPGVRLIVSNSDAPPAERIASEWLDALGAIVIDLPPLRSRRDDIPMLVQQWIEDLNRAGPRRIVEVSPKAWTLLAAYAWPGNIRELASVMQSAYAIGSGGILRATDLPASLRGEATDAAGDVGRALRLDPILARIERETILAALRQAGGQRNKAAQIMSISRSRLYRRMDALQIRFDEPHEPL